MRIPGRLILTTTALVSFLIAPGRAQETRSTPKFEVTSVQPSGRATNPFTWVSGGTLHGERFELRKATLLDLIRVAYRFDEDAISGGPDWLAINRYDIAAKAPAGPSPATLRLMLQTLLADRFGLVLTKDTRPMPAFVLTAPKAKMEAAAGAGESGCVWQRQPAASLLTVYFCRNISMDDFARTLSSIMGEYGNLPVVNQTALAGTWDFNIEYHSRARPLPAGTPRISFFDALARQSGLELHSAEAPAPVMNIDRAHFPTPDAPGVAKLIPARETEFEVATVRLSKLDQQEAFGTTKAGAFEARGADLRGLVTHSRDIEYTQSNQYVFGVPAWGDPPRYDIIAKPATLSGLPMTEDFRDDQMRLMLWNLLVERLRIQYHMEQRPATNWALVSTPEAAKKLKKADPAHRPHCEHARGLIENDPRDVHPEVSRLVVCSNITMAQLAAQLLGLAPDYFSQNVADDTHLTGHYDFTLNFSESDRVQQANRSTEANPNGEAAAPRFYISLQDAIQKTLGIKLEPRRTTVPVLVIDHYEKQPIEN